MMLDVLIKAFMIIVVCGIGILGAIFMGMTEIERDNTIKKRAEHERLKRMYAAQREFEERINNLDKRKQ